MVTLNILDSSVVLQVIVLILAVALSFMALRSNSFLWFIVSFVWLGLAVLLNDSQWIAIAAGGMALFSQAMFISGVTKRGRR